ncbi:MAG: hypothetical protein GWN59_05695 [Calditrichae bacterium]|nr:hypothetical protein [Calditrichia bacterium]
MSLFQSWRRKKEAKMIEWFSALSLFHQVLLVILLIVWLPIGWFSAMFYAKIHTGEWTPQDLCHATRPTWHILLCAYLGPVPLVVGLIFLAVLWGGYYLGQNGKTARQVESCSTQR